MKTPYPAEVMTRFYEPKNPFRMPDPDVVGRAGVPGRGPYMVLYLKTQGEQAVALSFQTYGCPPAIAAGSLLVEKLEGASRSEVALWSQDRIDAALGGLPTHKRHCSRLAAEAVRDALTRWVGAAPQPSTDPTTEESP